MKNKHLLVILFSFLAGVLQAATVSKNDALQKAQQFLGGRQAAARGAQNQSLSLRTAYEGSAYYVFNNGENGGFVIVSADDRTPAVLGYSDRGTFDPQNVPDNMRAFLQGYADEIAHIPATATAASRSQQRAAVRSSISPLVTTEWDQGNPYNAACPLFVNKARSVTGCVATAMAQVLRYIAYTQGGFPAATTQTIPSYQCATNWTGSGRITVPAISITTFDWNKMLPAYSGSETTEQQGAVAALMACCGASVEMDYADATNGGSSASLSSIPHALKTYFGFSNSVQYRDRDLFTTTEWEDIIYGELAASRPVLYGGQSTGGGHAFVCDGYDGDGFYHINWGWSGRNNGYFLLAALNPYDNSGSGASSSADGYSMQQDAIIGLQAASEDFTPEEVRMTVNKFNYNNSTTTQNKSQFVLYYSYSLVNNLSETYDVTLACDLFDENNQFIRNITTFYTNNSQNNVYYNAWKSGTIYSASGSRSNFNLGDLADGTYKLMLRSKLTSSDTYYDCFNNDRYYIQAVVSGSQITFSNVTPTVSLAASDITLTTDGVVNTVQTVTAKITNNGDSYHGSVYLFVDGTKVSGNGLSVEAGEKAMAYFSFKPTASGTKTLRICTDENGQNVIGTAQIQITNPVEGVVLPAVYYEIDLSSLTNVDESSYQKVAGENKTTVDAYTSKSSLRFKYINNSTATLSGVFMAIAKWNGSTYNDFTGTETSYNMPSGSNTGWINVTDFVEGYGKYEVRLYKNGSPSTENLLDSHFRFELVKGYVKSNADGSTALVKVTDDDVLAIDNDALAVQIDANVFSDVTPNSNPNTLYIITDGTTPTSLTGKNIIDGTTNTASTINLTDGISFAAPVTFTAAEISYGRQISTATDGTGNGWTTIILPFDVTEVYAGDEKIDWFHSSSDTNGRFWVRKFVSDGANSVSFDYTDEIKANTPYIIAVPGSKWGAQFDLTSKTLTFKGANATIANSTKGVVTGDSYKFVGASVSQAVTNGFVLNEAGSSFVKQTTTVEPFRAYFNATALTDNRVSSLFITSPGSGTTAVGQLPASIALPEAVYSLDGRRLTVVPAHGVYIKNGKKYIK